VGGHGLSRLSRHRLGFFHGRNSRPYNCTKRKRSRRSGRGCIARLYITTLARLYLTSPRHLRSSIIRSHHQHNESSSRSICYFNTPTTTKDDYQHGNSIPDNQLSADTNQSTIRSRDDYRQLKSTITIGNYPQVQQR